MYERRPDVQVSDADPLTAKEAGATVIDVNPERDALARRCDLFLAGPGDDVLPGS